MCNSVTTTLNLKLTWTSEKIYFLLIITYHIAKQTQDDLEGGYTSMLLCDYRSVLACRSHVFPNNVLAAELEFWKYSMCVIYLSSCKQILYFPKLQTWGRRFTQRRASYTGILHFWFYFSVNSAGELSQFLFLQWFSSHPSSLVSLSPLSDIRWNPESQSCRRHSGAGTAA